MREHLLFHKRNMACLQEEGGERGEEVLWGKRGCEGERCEMRGNERVQVLQLPHIKLLTSSSLVCETATSPSPPPVLLSAV